MRENLVLVLVLGSHSLSKMKERMGFEKRSKALHPILQLQAGPSFILPTIRCRFGGILLGWFIEEYKTRKYYLVHGFFF
jgi:hypothetical protein